MELVRIGVDLRLLQCGPVQISGFCSADQCRFSLRVGAPRRSYRYAIPTYLLCSLTQVQVKKSKNERHCQ